MSFTKKISQLTLLLATVLLLNGCAVKFVYNQLDWLIPIYIRNYIKLEGTQKDFVRDRIDHHLAWHRKTQLPVYAEQLRKIVHTISDKVDRETIKEQHAEVEQLGDFLVDAIAPDIANVLLTSNKEQLEFLQQKMDKSIAEFQTDYVDIPLESLKEKRAFELKKYIERWTGALTDEQQSFLQTWQDRYTPIAHELFEHQLAWQKEFKQAITSEASDEEKKNALILLLTDSDPFIDSEYQAKLDHNFDLTVELFLSLHQSLEEKQLKHLNKKMLAYAKDFEELSNDS